MPDLANDFAGYSFPGAHLLHNVLAVVGTAGLVCYLRRRFFAASAD